MLNDVYDIRLVCLSLLFALLTSYASLNLGHRIRFSQGLIGWIWLVTTASMLGGGIWALHMLAMLGYRAPVAIHYDLRLTVSSLIVVIIGSACGLAALQLAMPRWKASLIGATCICTGAAIMHAMGMAAMQMDAYLVYDTPTLVLSAIFSICALTAGLYLGRPGGRVLQGAAAAACMTAAIAGLHYTAMYAATMICTSPRGTISQQPSLEQNGLFLLVTASTFVIIFIALAAVSMDRWRASQEMEAWRASESRFRALYSQAPIPLHSVDLAGDITEVSDYWLQLLGYDRADVIGRPLTDFMTEASSLIHQANWPTLPAGQHLRDCELQFRRKDGAMLDMLLSQHVERDADGNFVRANGGLTDITARKHAEEACRQSQKMEAVGQLTGGIAHDFNNLLSAILGSLELALKKVEDPRVARWLETAQLAASRGAKLTSHMLAFSRRQDLDLRGVDVNDVVAGLRDMLQRLIGPMISVDFDLQTSSWPALTDSVQLEVSLVNLAVNARDAMPKGGSLLMATKNVTGAPGLPHGDYVAVSVTDSGEGMPENVRASAFQPFFTTKGPGKGTGLGLAMVYGFASQAGGTVTIDSAPGQGTTVTIYLRRTLPFREIEHRAPHAIKGASARILLVDDDEAVRDAVREMLIDGGHTVVEAANGGSALAALRRDRFDLIVTDFAMPTMNGLQLAKNARILQPTLPVLIMTGYVEGDLLNGLSDKNCAMLNKPFRAADLMVAVSDLT
jgi:PAS domain S-box-containing protein